MQKVKKSKIKEKYVMNSGVVIVYFETEKDVFCVSRIKLTQK